TNSPYTWWRYAAPAAGITWSSRMCSARRGLRRGRAPAAPGPRATERARPVSNEGRHNRSAGDARHGRGADGAGARPPQREVRPRKPGPHQSGPQPPRRPRSAVPPDDRRTSVLPPVRDEPDPELRDPIDIVTAALNGAPPTRPPQQPPQQPPPPPRGRGRGPGGPGEPPEEPANWFDRINWRWVRRGLFAGAVALLVLPIITFVMAYL